MKARIKATGEVIDCYVFRDYLRVTDSNRVFKPEQIELVGGDIYQYTAEDHEELAKLPWPNPMDKTYHSVKALELHKPIIEKGVIEIDWEQRTWEAAVAIMQGLMSDDISTCRLQADAASKEVDFTAYVARVAIDFSKALVAEYRKGE